VSVGTPGAGSGSVEAALREVERQRRRIEETARERAELVVTGEGAGGLVSVKVDHAMKVTGIDINARAMRMTSFQLAEALQEAIDAAYAAWQERTATLLGPALVDPDLLRQAADGSLSPEDFFRRYGVDIRDPAALLDRRWTGG
jgi:DNA-binding protein YbaB